MIYMIYMITFSYLSRFPVSGCLSLYIILIIWKVSFSVICCLTNPSHIVFGLPGCLTFFLYVFLGFILCCLIL
jgi:hypothetical protein